MRAKERCSETEQVRGVYAGAFGSRVGEDRASRRQWIGALLVVDWWQ